MSSTSPVLPATDTNRQFRRTYRRSVSEWLEDERHFDQSHIEIVSLNLDRVPHLGISIVGQSNSRGDSGIYVANVRRGGAVAIDGRIEVGDRIRQVNEFSLVNLTSDQAVYALRQVVEIFRSNIWLTVEKHDDSHNARIRDIAAQSERGTVDASTGIEYSSMNEEYAVDVPLIPFFDLDDLDSGSFGDSLDDVMPLNWQPPTTENRGQGVPATAPVPSRQPTELIDSLRAQNETPAPAMSRSCKICFTASPHQRAVFSACGHTLCRACAEQLKEDAMEEYKALICPFCRAESVFVPLYEDPVPVDGH